MTLYSSSPVRALVLSLFPAALLSAQTVVRVKVTPSPARVVAAFDNEPANCNVLLEQNPAALSVLIDTQHLPGAPPLDPRVKVIANFCTE